jgi:hypothetical protein
MDALALCQKELRATGRPDPLEVFLMAVPAVYPGQTHQSLNQLTYAWGLPKKMLASKDIRN